MYLDNCITRTKDFYRDTDGAHYKRTYTHSHDSERMVFIRFCKDYLNIGANVSDQYDEVSLNHSQVVQLKYRLEQWLDEYKKGQS